LSATRKKRDFVIIGYGLLNILFKEVRRVNFVMCFHFILVVHQVASIISSLASMGWAMASYHRSVRLAQQHKLNIGIFGTVLQFLWHFCITGMLN
jgi:hypothetical protein